MSEFTIKLGCFVTASILIGIPFFTGYVARDDKNSWRIGLIMTSFEMFILLLTMWKMLGLE